ncbi:MAG TPA: sigma 54-interacting transcriptional regulator [Kofleriaceae bacterium]|nr:sigma 54-interacting transcriptional regulator [Kofleriaceae bacterium]
MGPLSLVADLLAAAAEAHTRRGLARALAEALAAHLPLTRLTLGEGPEAVAVVAAADGWRVSEPSPRRRALALAPGLSIEVRGRVPAYLREPDVRAALARLVAVTLAHVTTVERIALGSRRAHAAGRELRADLERLREPPAVVARSPAMRAVMERVAAVAPHPTTVLVTGESGTGKEVIARELHRRSPRAHRPMVQLNCGAIPEALVEAELFGHERGAFTGADRARPGVFERADHGTLLLDEVGELPPAAQVKLLRVVQERPVRRVGGAEDLPVDVRLIAATNRSLLDDVRAGRFREDLYYRLAVFEIPLPPLRDRAADLAPLAAAIVASRAAGLGVAPPPLSRTLLARLEAHDWPGNVRELENVLETALILGGGDGLRLPAELAALPPRPRDDGTHLDAAIRAAIERVLRLTRGAIYGPAGAAARLGLRPTTLQSKMRKLGIRRTAFTAGPD